MATITTIRDLTKIAVPDTASRLTDDDRDSRIGTAVKRYSKDAPLLRDADLTGDGSAQRFTVPADWTARFSELVMLEHPVDEDPPNMKDLQDNVFILQKANVEQIIFEDLVLASAEKARIFYTTVHTLDGSSSTIRPSDEEALADLASAMIAEDLAGFYAEQTDSTIGADVIDAQGRYNSFIDLARQLRNRYNEHMSTSEAKQPVLQLHDQDLQFIFKRDFLWKPKLLR